MFVDMDGYMFVDRASCGWTILTYIIWDFLNLWIGNSRETRRVEQIYHHQKIQFEAIIVSNKTSLRKTIIKLICGHKKSKKETIVFEHN